MSELYERKIYTLPIKYLFNTYIREYDISKCNVNVLLYKGIINKEEYTKIMNLSREYRQVHIGYILKDERINRAFEEGLTEVRKSFLEMNELNEGDILSIKNDAIFVINKIPTCTSIGNIRFLNKNTYTSFLKLANMEIYYGLDRQSNTEVIDVKGINDSKLEFHKNGILDIICNTLWYISNGDSPTAIDYISDTYKKYINKQLPIDCYRNFDNMSMYDIVVYDHRYGVHHLNNTPENLELLDISYNGNLLRELYTNVMEYSLGGRK